MVKIDGVWKVEKVSEVNENIIFYTKNEEGKYVVPSITIFAGKYNVTPKNLSNINKIYRINGNGKDGNLEEEMESILKNKLEELKNNGEVASFSVDYF